MKKKIICLLTNWYPTKENPHQGLFFKEQAMALSEYYDFIVVHYNFSKSILRTDKEVVACGIEKNIKEYQLKLIEHPWTGIFRRIIYGEKSDLRGRFSQKFTNLFRQNIVERIDAFYCVSAQSEAGYVKMLAEAYNVPYIVSEHGPVPWLGTSVSNLHKHGIESANLLFAISYDKLRQIMMQDIKLPSCVFVGNMVDDKQFVYKKSGNDVKTFVMVGAHVFYKNYDMLIAVMTRLTEITSVPFRLMVVGYNANKGYSKDAELLESKIKNSVFSSSVEMIPSIPHSNMHEIYNRADAFVMTSIQEGMPVSAIEAGCCGLPIFSTRCGGVEDFVTDEIGRIYGVLDVNAFAQGLCDFIEEKLMFDSNCIRERVVSRFGKEAFVSNMVRAFDDVIENYR